MRAGSAVCVTAEYQAVVADLHFVTVVEEEDSVDILELDPAVVPATSVRNPSFVREAFSTIWFHAASVKWVEGKGLFKAIES